MFDLGLYQFYFYTPSHISLKSIDIKRKIELENKGINIVKLCNKPIINDMYTICELSQFILPFH